jgi:hypothetical protein
MADGQEEHPSMQELVDAEHDVVMARNAESQRIQDRLVQGFFPDASIPVFRDSSEKIRASQAQGVFVIIDECLEKWQTVSVEEIVSLSHYPHGGLHPAFIEACLEHYVEQGKLLRCMTPHSLWYRSAD